MFSIPDAAAGRRVMAFANSLVHGRCHSENPEIIEQLPKTLNSSDHLISKQDTDSSKL